MNKRIASLLLCFVMVFSILATAVSVMAASVTSTQLKVTPNKTIAAPGDTITYTIIMGPVSDMGSMQMCLDIPTGLTYVANSTELADNLKTTLGFDLLDWTETPSRMINGGASAADYECDTDTTIATFKCTVDDGATGTLEVGLTNLEFCTCLTFEDHTDRFSVVKTPVTITAAAKPATNVTLNKSTTTIYTGGSETLVATVSPTDTTDTLTWESTKTSVATVDATGKVTAVAPGTATITAKAGSQSASCVVTVENAPCTHASVSSVSAKASTCTDKGWDAYKQCGSCGQLFDAAGNQISEIPYRSLASHTGGTATCLERAVCTECHQPYGNFADHDYTKRGTSALAKKSDGTCKDEAVYWYSCSVCNVVEGNDSHTFKGEKDATNHVGGTYKTHQKEANCKEEGYTGDIHCLGCDEKLSDGTTIGKAEHNPSTLWSSNDTKHWKECTNVIGCGVKLQEGDHTSTDGNVATCKHVAVCDICLEEYGALGAHTEGTEWKSDANYHWHVCTVADCGAVIETSKVAHTPDHEGGASTEYEVKCRDCGYVIYAKLNKVVPRFKISGYEIGKKITDVTVTLDSSSVGILDIPYYGEDFAIYPQDPSASVEGLHSVIIDDNAVFEADKVYYLVVAVRTKSGYSVAGLTQDDILLNGSQKPFGFIESEMNMWPVFQLDALHAHIEGDEWKSDADNHWHVCTVASCGVVIDSSKAAHTFERKTDKEATATEKGSKHEECTVCGYKKAAVEIPATEPTTPSESTTPENPTKPENSNTPQTGDNSTRGLLIALVFISGLGVVGTTVYSKKKKVK